MKIPKRFKLMGQTVEVVYKDDFRYENDWHGLTSFRRNKIELQTPSKDNPIPDCQIEGTFCHELMHFILFFTGSDYKSPKDDLHCDEHLVDLCGQLLHQALSTMEFEE